MKTCKNCGVEKDLKDFHVSKTYKGKESRMAHCIPCHAERARGYTKKNADWLREQKAKPCVDCGIELPPTVMELDHIRGPKRKFSKILTSRPALELELKKCEIRCPNCHKLRHYREGTIGKAGV